MSISQPSRRAGVWAAAIGLATLLTTPPAEAQPVLLDPSLQVETVVTGLSSPTTMAFLGPGEFLVLEKDTGRVFRILNGAKNPATPVLTLPVENASERGLLGIAIDTSTNPDRVFIYYTRDADDNGTPEANRIARFDWDTGTLTLINETVLRDLPGGPGPNHDGGVLALDGAGLLYAMIGDLNLNGQTQNNSTGLPDDTSVILRLNQDGTAAAGNPLSPYCSNNPAQTCAVDGNCTPGTCQTKVASYFAYGVRNGFGMGIDPITGELWDTENGPGPPAFDEVNLVAPGFNSGWRDEMGPACCGTSGGGTPPLFTIPGSAYSDPEFSWRNAVAPTAIVFPALCNLGPLNDDAAIVGDVNNGRLYRFPLNDTRDAFDLAAIPGLGDLVADDATERDRVLLGTGFFATDLEMGPDGALYAVSFVFGAVYRISNPGRDFFTVPPCRVVDTRNPAGPFGGPALASGVERVFTLAGQCGVPSTAKAVSLNATVTQSAGGGFLTLFPGNLVAPGTSNINFSIGQTRANNAVVHLSTNGSGQIRVVASSSTHRILDVNGYFQ